jgi:ribosome recycling factor
MTQMSVETVVEEVKAEATKVEGEVKAAVAEVKEEVTKAVAKTTQELTAEEKLAIREIENEYLKAQIEINRLSTITQGAQKKFTSTVESLTKKYVVDPTEWVFDNVELLFRKK